MFLDIGVGALASFRAVRRETMVRALPLVAIATAFLLVLGGSAALVSSLRRLEGNFEQVGRTERVLRHATRLGTEIGSAEATARSYMLTAKGGGLDKLNRARRGISQELRALDALSAGDGAQLRRLVEIDRELSPYLGSYDKALEPGDAQLNVLLAYLHGAPLRMAPGLDKALYQFRDAEFVALRQRQMRAAREVKYALAVSVLALFLALISVTIGLYLIVQQRARGELNKLREEFGHISRLNTMGEVAATLAHEVKQPLTASTNYLSVVKRQLANDEIDRDKLADIVNKVSAQVGRAADIIQHLRSHVSRSSEAVAPEQVEATIDEAIALSGIAHANVIIGLRIEENLPRVCIDKIQIQQVLVNLMRNAMEAMAESPRKSIVFTARRMDGHMVRIEVRDSGPGLPEKVRENLFKPFVTTKASGMGVGLSICRSIIQAHGGNIIAEAGPDGGTVFAFTVPQA